jgi:hypothetical protein
MLGTLITTLNGHKAYWPCSDQAVLACIHGEWGLDQAFKLPYHIRQQKFSFQTMIENGSNIFVFTISHLSNSQLHTKGFLRRDPESRRVALHERHASWRVPRVVAVAPRKRGFEGGEDEHESEGQDAVGVDGEAGAEALGGEVHEQVDDGWIGVRVNPTPS